MPKVLSEHHSVFDKSTFYFYQGNVKKKTIFSNNFKSIPYYYEEKTPEKKSKSKIAKLFFSYSTNNQYLTKRQIIRLMKKEFKLSYSKNVVTSLIIWG